MKFVGVLTAVLVARAAHEGTPIVEAPPPVVRPALEPHRFEPPPSAPVIQPPAVVLDHVEFHIQIKPLSGAKGLAPLWYPQPGTDLPVYTGRVGIVYEWRPTDGLEYRINPRTGKDWGPIWKDTVAEQMLPDNLKRHLDSVDKWIGAHVPADFEGPVSIDVERWPLRSDSFHLVREPRAMLERLHPGKTQAELMAEFMKVTMDRAKQVRPRVSGWGWWSMGTMHPGFPTWHANLWKEWRTNGYLADQAALKDAGIPFPSFYYPTTYGSNPQARAQFWPMLKESWTLLYGADRLAKDGYAYLNVRHSGLADKAFADKPVTREQFHECVQAAWDLGIRRFIIWDAYENAQVRDTNQRYITDILVPEARYWSERARAERRR